MQEHDIGLGLVGLLDQLVDLAIAVGPAGRVGHVRQIFVIIPGELGIRLLRGGAVAAHADHFLRHAAAAGDDRGELPALGG